MAISYTNLSRLVRSSDLLPRLQYLKLVGGEKNVNFQWLGPHFLAFLCYAKKLCLCSNYRNDRFCDLLKRLDDLASDCIVYGETELYKKFKDVILSFMPELRDFFVVQKLQQLSDSDSTPNTDELMASFIGFLVETIRELLNCGTGSNVLVSNQVKFLLKKLESLLAFVADTPTQLNEKEQNNNIMTEIESVANDAGFFLHSFIFTTELVTETNMDLTLTALVERIEIVQLKIKDHCIVVPKQPDCGIGSLQVAESPSEVSSHVTKQIENHLLRGLNNCQIISIVGMPGLGKTTLAKKLYNDYKFRSYFHVLSWCVVSQTYKKRKLLIDILSSASILNRDEISEMEDEELAERLYKNLKGRRYFIVMDDLWDKEAWEDLKRLFPEDKNGSRVLFTSRLKNVASELSHAIIEPPPLSQAESWELLEQQVFNKERCPHDLRDIGKEIATNCHGLPLLVVVIASVLSNMEKKISLWQQVATSMSSYISEKADKYIPILKLSYKNLPIHLKPCFLYLSAFEEDEEISVRKLLLLWIAEGFIEKKEQKSLEDVAEEYLVELINRSLLQVAKTRSDNGVKSCTMHDLILDMCSKIAEEEKFLFEHQFLISKRRRARRLCMDQSHHLSEALSIHYNLEKIRILDLPFIYAEKVRVGIEIMPDLRYLEIFSLEPSIGRFQNLEYLRAKIGNIPTYLLNMPKLRHLHVKGVTRFSENCYSSQINSLQTLSVVLIRDSKDEEILKCSPNLRRLKCVCPPNYCPDLNFFTQLESLKMGCKSRFRGDLVVKFPKNIKKLTLSGIKLPWEKMSLIGTLRSLEILKLRGEAFIGDVWNTNDDEFQKLKFLKLHFLKLKQWNSSDNHFPVLERLVLDYCKQLEMIPSEFSYISTLQKIEVYFCGIDAEHSAFQIREEQRDFGNEEFEVTTSNCKERFNFLK